jgi:hypothetical protein
MKKHRVSAPVSHLWVNLAGIVAFSAAFLGHGAGTAAGASPLPLVEAVEAQPLLAQAQRVIEALDVLGDPLPPETKAALERASRETDDRRAVKMVQEALDPHCLLAVRIDPASRLTVTVGPARPELVEQGWRQFLIKVYNEAESSQSLRPVSPNALSLFNSPAADVRNRWLDMQMYYRQPFRPQLSGLAVEYLILQLYSRDAGRREAKLWFDIARDATVDIVFDALPSNDITLRVLDEEGRPTTAGFIIRDQVGRIYPSLAKRLAPDFFFHPQVYRSNDEKIRLPAGDFSFEVGRGPEYLTQSRTVRLDGTPQTFAFNLERWVDPSRLGWWSGDHHIHAAGCLHYSNPTQGVHPPDVIRHCMGEDLKVGCALTWGEGFDYQKQFFTGDVDPVSQFPYLLRYDVEVSGFGSYRSGHLCLLRLKDQIYPGGTSTSHWPTLCLNTLKWAKKQGALCGFPHSGWGLRVSTRELPNYTIPRFDDTGANEYIVDVTHEVPGPDGQLVPAVDFISAVDTPYVWELNIWYHTLNCGFRTRISGETDFPCIYDLRVGAGRSYVKLDGPLALDQWFEGIRRGRNYVSDGRSHLMEFKVNDVALGEKDSELRLAKPSTVRITAKVAALLSEKPDPVIQKRNYAVGPYWHLERARIDESREVPVEVVMNGFPVARKNIVADGKMQDLAFDVPVERSSWVALRILPSSHTNPVFVLVGDQPIRASRRSAEWCLKGVDQCWSQKQRFIRPVETEDANSAYDHARAVYRRIMEESDVE